jgi:putative flippase GtrA
MGALSSRIKRFVAASLASSIAGIVDLALLVAFVEVGTRVPVAAFVASACGAIVHFTWSKYLAFRDRSSLAIGQMLRFAGVALATALLTAFAMQLFAVELRAPYALAKVACSVLVFVGWTYPAQRYFVFTSAIAP